MTQADRSLKLRLIFKDIFLMTVATFIVASAVFFFLYPSHASISSIVGLAIILSNFINLSIAQITMILNVFLLIIGFILFGKEFGAKTIYTSVLLPVILGIFEKVFPNYKSITGDSILDVTAYILIVSFGAAILFNDNASSGGLDIVAKILNKYLHIELGRAMSFAGICVALSSIFVSNPKIVVLSLIGTYFNGIVLDYFIFGHNIKRRVCIISEKEEEIKDFIINEMKCGATIYKAIGAYNNESRNELISILTKNDYRTLINFIAKTDPNAFVTVYTVSEVYDTHRHQRFDIPKNK
ncbi:YitT family protein [Lachnobacterium bovis]|uniref:Uncharacterized membrane-anchored protein YitT, contains DUF161 and DUF2179 domains n=1 Tax=Lachnobacterium bovis TaxID=140626 RepID=A0A1H9R4Q8_9FIRM|nr:YitT family protein [Lachnobacterium bovis]SER67712.1 Uncharacterized membrane-anchored protein YitT, contains DUF161 and DUF2179 domains [Lachnobacterium bovis]